MKNYNIFRKSKLVLMCSGGSDSTALLYKAADLCKAGILNSKDILVFHFNHKLRQEQSYFDAAFTKGLAEHLGFSFVLKEAVFGQIQDGNGQNMEASARALRYSQAFKVAKKFAKSNDFYLLTAHTLDDRIETFYMRSIVGTGPGGLRSISFYSDIAQIIHPLIDYTHDELRDFIKSHSCVFALKGHLWCDDETNMQTNRFRTFIRHEIARKCKEYMPASTKNLKRTMELIEQEDDFIQSKVDKILILSHMVVFDEQSFKLLPDFGKLHPALQGRCVFELLGKILNSLNEFSDFRIEYRSVKSVLSCFEDGLPISGKVINIQGNLAVSSNKHGVLVEPMTEFRRRRKSDKM